MPLLKLETTQGLGEEKRNALLTSLSKVVADATAKPEQFVMVSISQTTMLMSGRGGDAAFVDIRSIGSLSGAVNRRLAQQVCKVLHDSLGIAPQRVYLNFTDIDAGNWGWNNSTFG
jgi:phenylpyruvate tautomerase PptA (4-oxalocrotonate tautomerase family)